MGAVITIALSDEDISAIRNMRVTLSINVQYYEKKEDTEEGLTEKEAEEFSEWIWREILFNRIEALIDNELIMAALHNGPRKVKYGEALTYKCQSKMTSYEDIERLKKLRDELSQALSSPEATAGKRGMYSDNEFLSLSGKELKELVNKWIVHHVENDINLSPGYFERLLRGWETIYRRQCGMSMLDTF